MVRHDVAPLSGPNSVKDLLHLPMAPYNSILTQPRNFRTTCTLNVPWQVYGRTCRRYQSTASLSIFVTKFIAALSQEGCVPIAVIIPNCHSPQRRSPAQSPGSAPVVWIDECP